MLIHISVIALQCTALTAFLILWYFWVRRKLGSAFLLDGGEQVLFPFRHFSWILMGLVVVTCVAQVHFVRVSSTVHERMSALAGVYGKQDQQGRDIEDLKNSVEKLRREVGQHFRDLRVQIPQQLAKMRTTETIGLNASQGSIHQEGAPSAREFPQTGPGKDAFAREARASSRKEARQAPAEAQRKSLSHREAKQVHAMRLNRQGLVTTDNLNVKKEPKLDSLVIETIQSGDNVKVMEKRLERERMWFRVITPSGRAGWVEFHHVRLGGNA